MKRIGDSAGSLRRFTDSEQENADRDGEGPGEGGRACPRRRDLQVSNRTPLTLPAVVDVATRRASRAERVSVEAGLREWAVRASMGHHG